MWVDLNKKDPNQPWALGEPRIHSFTDVSNIAVMMNGEGNWITVNTANNTMVGNAVICLRHTAFNLHNIGPAGAFTRFYRHYKSTKLSYQDARATCQGQDADLGRLYGSNGIAAMNVFLDQGYINPDFWLGISNIENNMREIKRSSVGNLVYVSEGSSFRGSFGGVASSRILRL